VVVWLNVALPLGLIGTGIRDVQTSGAYGRAIAVTLTSRRDRIISS
jgi:hypothetical protein